MNPYSISPYETIADGLADQGYATVDNFLDPSQVRAILQTDEFKNGLLQFKKAGTGRNKQLNESIRGDHIRWLDRQTASSEFHVYFERLRELMSFVNRSLFLSLKDYEVHATIYPPGTFYKRHLDQFQSTDHRKLSVICYLNDLWSEEQGGQLRMFLPGGAVDIFPVAGRLVCFRSDLIEHEVISATRDRLSITGWILDEPRN